MESYPMINDDKSTSSSPQLQPLNPSLIPQRQEPMAAPQVNEGLLTANYLGIDGAPPDPLNPIPDPTPSDVPPTTEKTPRKKLRDRFRYGRREHDKDMQEVKSILNLIARPVARLALRAETYDGRKDIDSYSRQRFMERLWKRTIRFNRAPYL